MIKETIVIVALFSCVYATATKLQIDRNSSCSETFTVGTGNEYIIQGMGDPAVSDCSYDIRGQMRYNCYGLCYNLVSGSFFKVSAVTLTVKTNGEAKVFSYGETPMMPWCSTDMDMTVTFEATSAYVYDPKNPGYDFSLAVYNKCGQLDDGISISFEEAIKNLENYHHGEKFDDNVRKNMVHGILVGCCLALVFLIILLITYCYYKHSPNRGRSRSVGMPKLGFSKKMDVKGESKKSQGRGEPEAHYKYTASDPERVERQPESKPLLAITAADPEKPPAESKFDPSVDPPHTAESKD